jgi:hypothetical protein
MVKGIFMFLKKQIKTLLVNLGFLQTIETHISNNSFKKQILKSRKFIIKNVKTYGLSYESFFVWIIYYNKLNNNLLMEYLNKRNIRFSLFLLIKFSRSIFFIFDFIFFQFIILFLKIEYLDIKKFENEKIFIFTKGKSKENFYKYFENDFFDLYSIYKNSKYKLTINTNFYEIYCLFKFKFNNQFISSLSLLNVYYFKKYFETFLSLNKGGAKVLIREGMTPITKMIYEVGYANNIDSRIYLNTLIYNYNSFFPLISVLLQHKCSDHYNYLIKADKKIINDNPNLNWRLNRNIKKKKTMVGIILGDFYNRYSLQNYIDSNLFDSLRELSNIEFIIRPHPQEFSDRPRINYYHNLSSKLNKVEIDSSSNINYFINNSSIVISTCTSTLVEECSHSGITILRYKILKNTDINDDFFNVTKFINYTVNNKNLIHCINNIISNNKNKQKNFFSNKSLRLL